MHTVIVGGGFAGVKAALELSAHASEKVTLISDEDHFLHHATLYSTATGKALAESVAPLHEVFEGRKNVTIVQDRIVSLDADKKQIKSAKHSYRYDKLVLALGSVTTYFGIKGMQRHAFGIKTLQEVKKFSDHILEEVIKDKKLDRNYVIIGGGPTGVELAGALDEYLEHLASIHHLDRAKVRVTLVEASDRILPGMSKTASRIVKKRLESLGIRVLTNHRVEALSADVITIDGKKVPTSTAVWTSGVANAPFFSENADAFERAPNGRVIVDEHLQSSPDIYVIGDNNTVKYSGLAFPAMDQAEYVAHHITNGGDIVPFKPKQPVCGVPVGSRWAYTEWHGVYAAGILGYFVRRRTVLRGYKRLLPKAKAYAAWSAHTVPQIDD